MALLQNRIYEIRGEKVMLDFDLAQLYEVETRVMNQAIKRNLDSFPEDFMFKLTGQEWQEVLAFHNVTPIEMQDGNSSQIVMSSLKHRGAKYMPYVFTEHGVTR